MAKNILNKNVFVITILADGTFAIGTFAIILAL